MINLVIRNARYRLLQEHFNEVMTNRGKFPIQRALRQACLADQDVINIIESNDATCCSVDYTGNISPRHLVYVYIIIFLLSLHCRIFMSR